MTGEEDWAPSEPVAPDFSAQADPSLTSAGVYRRSGEHVHGAGPRVAKGVRLCCYCDIPVRLTELGWQPLSTTRSLAHLAKRRDDDLMSWDEARPAARWRWWHWIRYPAQGWRAWKRNHF